MRGRIVGPGKRMNVEHTADNDPNSRGRASAARDRRWDIALLIAIAGYFLIWPLYRAFFPLEIAPNEAWNAYHQDAAAAGGALYPEPGALTTNNYPPLSFYAIGWIAKLAGLDALYVGRAVSLLATLALGAVIAAVVRQLNASRYAAAIAGAWFVAIMARTFNQFVGMNDPQLAGQLIMACALLWFLRRDAVGKSPEPAIVLMVVAGFWKHNIVTIPAAVLLWLLFRDGRRAVRPCLIGLAAAVLGLLLCLALYGNVFLFDLLAPRKFIAARVLIGVGRLQWIAPALVIWAVWAWYARRSVAAQFSSLLVGIGLCVHLIQWSGDAVVNNSQFDLVIAVAIGLGLAYDGAASIPLARRWGVDRARHVAVAILALRLVVTGRVEPALIAFDADYRALFHERAAIARREAARVAAIAGPVGCDNKVVCRMAGKVFVFDEFKAEEMIATGMISPGDLRKLLQRRQIRYVAIDPRARSDSLVFDLFKGGLAER